MREQLTKVKNRKLKNFSYGSILTAFTLEKILLMQPQYVSLGLPPPTEPQMQRWVDLTARHAGQSQVSFSDTFFEWFNHLDMVYPSIHMLVWISGVIRIWYCLPVSSGVSSVNSLTIFLFIISLYNFLVLSSIKTNQNSCAQQMLDQFEQQYA